MPESIVEQLILIPRVKDLIHGVVHLKVIQVDFENIRQVVPLGLAIKEHRPKFTAALELRYQEVDSRG